MSVELAAESRRIFAANRAVGRIGLTMTVAGGVTRRARVHEPEAAEGPDAPMTVAEVHAAIHRLEEADHELQIQAHAINLSIGEVRRKRLSLLRRLDASRSA